MIHVLRQQAGNAANPIHILRSQEGTDPSVPTLCGRTFGPITKTWEGDVTTATCVECLELLPGGHQT